jgi:hypothetical protein
VPLIESLALPDYTASAAIAKICGRVGAVSECAREASSILEDGQIVERLIYGKIAGATPLTGRTTKRRDSTSRSIFRRNPEPIRQLEMVNG